MGDIYNSVNNKKFFKIQTNSISMHYSNQLGYSHRNKIMYVGVNPIKVCQTILKKVVRIYLKRFKRPK